MPRPYVAFKRKTGDLNKEMIGVELGERARDQYRITLRFTPALQGRWRVLVHATHGAGFRVNRPLGRADKNVGATRSGTPLTSVHGGRNSRDTPPRYLGGYTMLDNWQSLA